MKRGVSLFGFDLSVFSVIFWVIMGALCILFLIGGVMLFLMATIAFMFTPLMVADYVHADGGLMMALFAVQIIWLGCFCGTFLKWVAS